MPVDGLFILPNTTSTSSADEDLIQRLRNLFHIARDFKRARYDLWIRNYRLVNNRLGGSSASWMPAPRDSEIYPVLSALVAHMTDQNVNIDFVPACDPNTSMFSFQSQLCDDLSAVLYSTWLVENYDSQVALGLWDAFMYGVGIYKNVWDQAISGGDGNAVLRRVDPWAFYPDPDATSMVDSNYFIEVRKMTFGEIERRFPDTCHLLRNSEGGNDPVDSKPNLFTDTASSPKANVGSGMPSAGTWPGINSVVQGRFGHSTRNRGTRPLPTYTVYEYWLRENEEIDDGDGDEQETNPAAERQVADHWRVVVVCNGQILMDEDAEDLWSHGQHPYERYVFDDIGEFYGVALVDHLAYPQIYINRLLTALQHNAELVGNPVLIEAANSGTSRVGITNRPGQRLTLNGVGAMQNKPEWMQPPSMPPAVMDLVKFWIDRIENTSGMTGQMKGQVPSQRQSEGLGSMAQEAAFVRVRNAIRNLEYTLQGCALKLSDLIVDNYTEPRIMAILGQDGQRTALALAGRHFWLAGRGGSQPMKYALQVRAGSSTPTSRNARIQEAEKLFALGAVDDQYVLETHQVRNVPTVLQRLYMKRQQGLIGSPGQRQRQGRSS